LETAGYTTLTRQSGLLRELQVVANNIANAPTTSPMLRPPATVRRG